MISLLKYIFKSLGGITMLSIFFIIFSLCNVSFLAIASPPPLSPESGERLAIFLSEPGKDPVPTSPSFSSKSQQSPQSPPVLDRSSSLESWTLRPIGAALGVKRVASASLSLSRHVQGGNFLEPIPRSKSTSPTAPKSKRSRRKVFRFNDITDRSQPSQARAFAELSSVPSSLLALHQPAPRSQNYMDELKDSKEVKERKDGDIKEKDTLKVPEVRVNVAPKPSIAQEPLKVTSELPKFPSCWKRNRNFICFFSCLTASVIGGVVAFGHYAKAPPLDCVSVTALCSSCPDQIYFGSSNCPGNYTKSAELILPACLQGNFSLSTQAASCYPGETTCEAFDENDAIQAIKTCRS
jgi:hypothetical protein